MTMWPEDFANVLEADAVIRQLGSIAGFNLAGFCAALIPDDDAIATALLIAVSKHDFRTRCLAMDHWNAAIQSLHDWRATGGAVHAISFMMSFQSWLFRMVGHAPKLLEHLTLSFQYGLRRHFPQQQELALPLLITRPAQASAT